MLVVLISRLAVKDNNYIQKWYRREMTLGESLWSVFGLHNETANIYSHLAGTSNVAAGIANACILSVRPCTGASASDSRGRIWTVPAPDTVAGVC